jgi:4-amino-4-deoxy-L-arabinose transferase-like glycosyltransferase
VAAIFRLYQFDSLPRGVWYDEAESGLQALRILAPGDYWPIFDGATAGAAHFLYLVAGSFELFGVSVQSIRTVNVFFGLAMVLAGYLVGRELFGDVVGLVVASFFAVSSWAVTFSRFGMYASNTTPLFALLTIGFLLRGWRRESMTDLALAGLWGGVGLCFYTSFRLFVPVVGLFALYALLWQRWRHGRWPSSRFWYGALVGVFVALLMVAPLVVFAYKQPDIFWARIENTSLSPTARWPRHGRCSRRTSASISSCSIGAATRMAVTTCPARRCSTVSPPRSSSPASPIACAASWSRATCCCWSGC